MHISRCRYWRCVKCQAAHTKKNLADILRRGAEGTDASSKETISCSRCGVRHVKKDIYAGEYDVPLEAGQPVEPVEVVEEAAGDKEAGVTNAAPPRKHRDELAPSWIDKDPERDKGAEHGSAGMQPRRKGPKSEERSDRRQRRRNLRLVNTGLAIHYGGMVAFMVGQAAGWLALILFLIGIVTLRARNPDASNVGTLVVSGILFLVSWGLTSCSALADLVSTAICLCAPAAAARGFLVAALVARVLALPAGVGLILIGQGGWAMSATSTLAVTGWVLWICFLRALSLDLGQPDLGKEAVRIVLSAIQLVVGWFVAVGFLVAALFALVAMRRFGGCFAGMIIVGGVGVVAGTLKYLVVSGKFDSLVTLFLYPTGIPLIQRYLDLVGTLRMIILRRS